jgi:hypothetical protein
VDIINFIKECPDKKVNIIPDFNLEEDIKSENWRSELNKKYYSKYMKYKTKYIELKKQK